MANFDIFDMKCNKNIYDNVNVLNETFPKGTIITICFDTRKCIVKVKEFFINEEGEIKCLAEVGINANGDIKRNHIFGVIDNEINFATLADRKKLYGTIDFKDFVNTLDKTELVALINEAAEKLANFND